MSNQPLAARYVLDNGLTLLIQENRFNETVAVSGRLKAGGMYDSYDLQGCAYFVANMLMKGTEHRTWEEIAETIESVGATLNVSGNTEITSAEGRCLSKDFDRVLDVLNDVLRHPVFPAVEIEKHRHQTLSWLKAWEDDTDYVADRLLSESVYPEEHPYHWCVYGTEASIGQIDQKTLAAFHKRYYRPDSFILAIVGDVDTQTVLEKVERAMGDWRSNGEKPPFAIPPVEYRKREISVKQMMDKSQAFIALGHKGIPRTHPDCYAFDLMNRILGGGAGIARLFSNVRDVKGLAYSVFSSFTPSFGEGLFQASAGVNPNNVDYAIESILSEIQLMKSNGVTEEELIDAQNLVVGNFALTLETNKGIAAVLALAELFGLGLDYPLRHSTIYRSVSRAQVNEAAEKYLHPEQCCIAIAGPYRGSSSSGSSRKGSAE
jgi:zinc protease